MSDVGTGTVGDDKPPSAAPRRVTIIDIAQRAGVSKSTVSLVLSGSKLVREGKRVRVQEAMEALGYVYHRGAANLRSARASLLGMVINDLANPFFTELAIGIERACQSSAMVPFIANTGEDPARQTQVIRLMREHGAAGLVICPAIGTDPEELNALTDGLPVAFAMRRLHGARGSVVVPDNRAGARRATAHLASLGHRRIAFLGGLPGMIVREERLAGYRDALAEAGLDADPALQVQALPTRPGGRAALEQVILLREPATACLCFNDVVAIGALHAIAERGLVAGRDVAVIGFDDIAEARQMAPPLTTVSVEAEGLGERAASVLLRQFAGGGRSPETVIGPANLVIRASCGAWLRQESKA